MSDNNEELWLSDTKADAEQDANQRKFTTVVRGKNTNHRLNPIRLTLTQRHCSELVISHSFRGISKYFISLCVP